jgi:hypothetical protein
MRRELDRQTVVVLLGIIAIVLVVALLVPGPLIGPIPPSPDSQPNPDLDGQAVAWCHDHDGDLVAMGTPPDERVYCVLPDGESVPMVPDVEVGR